MALNTSMVYFSVRISANLSMTIFYKNKQNSLDPNLVIVQSFSTWISSWLVTQEIFSKLRIIRPWIVAQRTWVSGQSQQMQRFFERVESTVVGSLQSTLKSLLESQGRIKSVMYQVENLQEDIMPVIVSANMLDGMRPFSCFTLSKSSLALLSIIVQKSCDPFPNPKQFAAIHITLWVNQFSSQTIRVCTFQSKLPGTFFDCFRMGNTDYKTSQLTQGICSYRLTSSLITHYFWPRQVLKNDMISLAICYTVNYLSAKIFYELLQITYPCPTFAITNSMSMSSLYYYSVRGGFLIHFYYILSQNSGYSIVYLYPKCAQSTIEEQFYAKYTVALTFSINW